MYQSEIKEMTYSTTKQSILYLEVNDDDTAICMTIKEELKKRTEAGESRKKAQVEIGKRVNKLISSGMTNSEIAKTLGLTESSIRSIRQKRQSQ